MDNYSRIEQRIPLIFRIKEFLEHKSVPRHRYTFFYLFGGLSLFLFAIQIITGILLALYYSPYPDRANESVRRIMTEVEFGWLIRSIHSWGANLMVAVVLVHMFSTYFMKAYRKPREFMWFSGVIIFFLLLGFAFTGYLLPWDTTAYFATLIGTEIPKSIPIIGDIVVKLLRGEVDVGEEALKRMYAIHVIILPLITLIVITFHILLQQALGSSIPIGIKEHGKPIPFFPNFLYRDFLAWVTITVLLVGFATILPWGLGEKADPYASAPVGIQPEWYFLPLYQTLKIFPTNMLSVNGEMIVNCLVLVGSVFWFLIPIIDKKANRDENWILFTWIGIILILYCSVSISLAYLI